MAYSGPERREYIRVALSIPIKYRTADSQGYVESQTEDISSGGMKILLTQQLARETILNLQFELLREEKIIQFNSMQARVVWVRPFSNRIYPFVAGIEFVNITEDERLHISNCIYHRAELLRKPFR